MAAVRCWEKVMRFLSRPEIQIPNSHKHPGVNASKTWVSLGTFLSPAIDLADDAVDGRDEFARGTMATIGEDEACREPIHEATY